MANNLTLADAVVSANTGLDAIKRAPIVEADTGIKCLRIQDVNQGKDFVSWGNTLVEKRNFEKFQLKESDILIARTGGSVGSSRYIYEELQAVYNNGLIRVRVNTKKHNPKFIYYLLQTKGFESHINGIAYSTSAQPNMKIRDFLRFEFKELGLNVENTIAEILSSLDAKIELNRLTNQTLEQMAQALFKSWFVDFDPVIDNALASGTFIPAELQHRIEMRKEAHALQKQNPDIQPLPAATQRLFPSEFEHCGDNTLGIQGWIPKGWKVITTDELNAINPESWTKKNAPEAVTYVDLANAKNGTILETEHYIFDEAPSRARRILKKHDIIIGVVRPANRSFAYVNENGLTGSTGFAVVRPLKESYRAFTYFSLTDDDCINEFTRIADGAAYPAIKPSDVADARFLYSNEKILEKFEMVAGQFLLKKAGNEKQIKPLLSLRDTLLPKLISGELSLNKEVAL